MRLKNLQEAEKELAKYIPAVNEVTGKDITLERMRPFMAHLGNPHEKLKIIHVAGTSGKTSTCYYLAALLRETGSKVGLTVSPHITSVTERVQINLKTLSNKEFCHQLGKFLELVKTSSLQPTYFELIIGFAFWYFAKTKVDYAVMETGLGGLHDATNIASRPDKLCVITDIGLDHEHILGNTLAKISKQKAGIIYPSNQVFISQQTDEVMKIFANAAKTKKAKLNVLSNNETLVAGSMPKYQQRNWRLADFVFRYIVHRDKLKHLDFNHYKSTESIKIPGRMDMLARGGKTVVLDGAHNYQKMKAFIDSFKVLFPNAKVPIVLSLKQDKSYKDVLPIIKPICTKLVLTTFKQAQDLPAKPTDPKFLADYAKKFGLKDITVEPSLKKALQLIGDYKLAIVTGSLYLIGDAKKILNEKN